MMRSKELWIVVAAGAILGGLGVLLAAWGNPENSGICVSCFIENSAGALGLHDNPNMQYLRPELIGFVLGSTASALSFREFGSRGGSSPLSRFFMGMFIIFGCAVFYRLPNQALPSAYCRRPYSSCRCYWSFGRCLDRIERTWQRS